jgi:hypothetical protein
VHIDDVINFLKEFKKYVGNEEVSKINSTIELLTSKRDLLVSILQQKKELTSIIKSKWYSTIILSAYEANGINLDLLRKAFGKENSFFLPLIRKLVKKDILKEASEEEKLAFINKNRNFLEGLKPYHFKKMKVWVLTDKGRKIVEILKAKRKEVMEYD